MKKINNNLVILALFLTSAIAFAQGPDPDTPLPGDTNPTDAPLDGMHFIVLLMFMAIAIAFFTVQKKRKSGLYE